MKFFVLLSLFSISMAAAKPHDFTLYGNPEAIERMSPEELQNVLEAKKTQLIALRRDLENSQLALYDEHGAARYTLSITANIMQLATVPALANLILLRYSGTRQDIEQLRKSWVGIGISAGVIIATLAVRNVSNELEPKVRVVDLSEEEMQSLRKAVVRIESEIGLLESALTKLPR